MTTIYDSKSFFKSYFDNTNEKKKFIEHFSFHLKKIVSIKTLLDIGSHDGSLLKRVIENNNPSYFKDTIEITCLDPANVKEALIENLKNHSSKIHFLNTTIENYFSKTNDFFDIIIASHCLYWTEDLTSVIREINQRAQAAVIVFRTDVGIFQIQSQFKHLLGNPLERLYNSKDVERVLKKLKIAFKKELIQSQIRLPTRHSILAENLLSFFLQTDVSILPDTEKCAIRNYVYRVLSPNQKYIDHAVNFFWLGDLR